MLHLNPSRLGTPHSSQRSHLADVVALLVCRVLHWAAARRQQTLSSTPAERCEYEEHHPLLFFATEPWIHYHYSTTKSSLEPNLCFSGPRVTRDSSIRLFSPVSANPVACNLTSTSPTSG